MWDFGALPPEINSARIYAGPGSAPLVGAAGAWQHLATELNATAVSYTSIIATLTSQQWLGPSSIAMAAAAIPYVAWLRSTAGQAEQTAAQAMAAVGAYESAYAMTVPPAVVTSNRTLLATLVATNILGQNTPAIANVEAQYSEMWAQDAAAMTAYAGSSASAARLTPFTSPAPTTKESLASPAAAPAAAAALNPLSDFFDLDVLVLAQTLESAASLSIGSSAYGEQVRSDYWNQDHDTAAAPTPAQTQDHNHEGNFPTAVLFGARSAGPQVGAFAGRAAMVGALSVPQTWAVPPAVRQIAATLPMGTPSLVVQEDSQNPYTGVALSSLMGSGLAGLAVRGGSSPGAPGSDAQAGGGKGAAAARPAVTTAPPPAAASAVSVPGLPDGLPPDVVANLAATLAAIPGATIIVVPPNPNK
jgi:hypothetical protein